jgi:hypothetical protein
VKYNKIIRLIGASSAILVASCTSGGSKSTAGATDLTAPTTVQERVFFDAMSQIPAEGADKEFVIRLHNSYSSQFSLQSVVVIDPLTNKVATNLATVKSAMCSLVPANNSCSLNLTPHLQKSGSFILQAKLTDNKGELHTVRQLIRLSDKIASSNGILFDNDLTTVSAPDGVYHLAFPVMLDEQFDELKASNGSVLCSGGFNAGSNCTYFVDGKALGDNTLIATKLEGYRNGKLVATRAYTTRATTDTRANLLISQPEDINIAENASESSVNVVLFNNGLASASSVVPGVTGANSRLSILASTCPTNLVPGANCNFSVKARSEVHGTGTVEASYGNGLADGADKVSTNIVYTKANLPAKLVLSSVAGSLSNSFVGIPATEYLVISNTGTRKLTALSYKLDKTTDFVLSGASSGAVSGCGASGSLELEPAQKCALKVVYTPTMASTGINEYKLSVSGSYTNSNSLAASIISELSRPYSALGAANVLGLSAESFNITAKTSTTESRNLVVTNSSPFDVTLGTLELNPTTVTGLTIKEAPASGNKCTDNSVLVNGNSCNIAVTYAAPATAVAATSANVVIPVAKIGTRNAPANTKREANITVRAVTKFAPANIQVVITPPSSLPSGVSAAGLNTYSILGLPGNSLKLTYKFTAETGKGDAALFNVSSAGLPVGAQIISTDTTCPTGVAVGSLNDGQFCTVVVEAPRASLVATGLLTAGPLNLILPYSWQDVTDTGVPQFNKSETIEQKISVTTDWLTNLNVNGTPFTANGVDLVKTRITTTFTNIVAGSSVQYPLTVMASIAGNPTNASCNIGAGVTTCPLDLNLPATIPAGDYYVDVEVRDATPEPNTRIYRKSVKVTK